MPGLNVFSSDDMTLLLLYMDDTRTGTIENLQEMMKCLAPDEKDLKEMAEKLLGVLFALSDEDFAKIAEEGLAL